MLTPTNVNLVTNKTIEASHNLRRQNSWT